MKQLYKLYAKNSSEIDTKISIESNETHLFQYIQYFVKILGKL